MNHFIQLLSIIAPYETDAFARRARRVLNDEGMRAARSQSPAALCVLL